MPEGLPCIVVANHSSYLDGIILTAVLPARFAFLIKQEMANVPLIGFVLKQIASEFVDRQNPQDRHRMARRLVESARRGWTLAVFPEGTFDTRAGLQRFHTGAFTAALRGSLPLVPVVIKGARAKMPGERIMPGPGKIAVHVCEPVDPKQSGDSIEALIAAARRAMLAHLDEPDLDPDATAGLKRAMPPPKSVPPAPPEGPRILLRRHQRPLHRQRARRYQVARLGDKRFCRRVRDRQRHGVRSFRRSRGGQRWRCLLRRNA